MPLPIETTIRPYQSDDFKFIFSTWIEGFYQSGIYFENMSRQEFFKIYEDRIKNTLLKSDTIKQICALKDDPTIILGYLIGEKMIETYCLHWLFVKYVWRKIGIAKTLLQSYPFTKVTHLTKLGQQLKPAEMTFQPMIF